MNLSDAKKYVFVITGLLMFIWGAVECLWGVLQIFGIVPSGHRFYYVTGSFYNPGPYGCFLAFLLPMFISAYCAEDRKTVKSIYWILFAMYIFLLPGGMSRSGWLAGAIGGGFTLYNLYKHKLHIRRLYLVGIVSVIAIASLYVLYIFKQDSADGRLLIWKIAIEYIDRIPLWGVGWQNVAGIYGEAQETFFQFGSPTERDIFLADSPSYLYNEYLQILYAFGIPSVLLFIFILGVSFTLYVRDKKYGFAGSLLAFAVICLSSYPLQFWEFKIAISVLIIISGLLFSKKTHIILGELIVIPICIAFSLNTINYDINGTYNKAYTLSKMDEFDKSNQNAIPLLQKCSSTQVLLFIGNNYQCMGERDSAAYYFEKAATRAPNRLYPHYRLMKLYLESPVDSAMAKSEAQIILQMTPKVPSSAAIQIKEDAKNVINRY